MAKEGQYIAVMNHCNKLNCLAFTNNYASKNSTYYIVKFAESCTIVFLIRVNIVYGSTCRCVCQICVTFVLAEREIIAGSLESAN